MELARGWRRQDARVVPRPSSNRSGARFRSVLHRSCGYVLSALRLSDSGNLTVSLKLGREGLHEETGLGSEHEGSDNDPPPEQSYKAPLAIQTEADRRINDKK